jgi:hypothetical protein
MLQIVFRLDLGPILKSVSGEGPLKVLKKVSEGEVRKRSSVDTRVRRLKINKKISAKDNYFTDNNLDNYDVWQK